MSDHRIRVLQVITRLVTRGASRHVIDLARSLDPLRFNVEIAAGHEEPYEHSIWHEAEALGIRCHRVEHLKREISPLSDTRALFELTRLIRDGHYDIVHTHISKSGLLGRLAARRAKVPAIVHTYHGIASEIAGVGARPAVLRRCERYCAEFTDARISISHRVAADVGAAGIAAAEDIHVIHNGIDLEHFELEESPSRPAGLGDGPVIGTVGSLTREKSTVDLLRAASLLVDDIPDLSICIVGDGPLREELGVRTQELGLAERVLFTGAVEDVRPWIRCFTVFMLPSYSEGFPITLIEAMALGCPVVATDVGGVSEVVGDAGVLVATGDIQGLADQTGRLLSDVAARQQLAEAGLARVQRFSLPVMARATASVYEAALSRA